MLQIYVLVFSATPLLGLKEFNVRVRVLSPGPTSAELRA